MHAVARRKQTRLATPMTRERLLEASHPPRLIRGAAHGDSASVDDIDKKNAGDATDVTCMRAAMCDSDHPWRCDRPTTMSILPSCPIKSRNPHLGASLLLLRNVCALRSQLTGCACSQPVFVFAIRYDTMEYINVRLKADE